MPTVDDILADGGLISEHFPGYEPRTEQLDMAHAIDRAIDTRQHILAEAGTGVGKSFAYLVPTILNLADSQHKAVISTYTISLQEQLIEKDLPLLNDLLPETFRATLVKGRSNYLCFRRMAWTVKNRNKLIASDRHMDQLETLCDWAMETETGELQDVDFSLDRTLWSRVCAQSGLCRGKKCSHYDKCHLIAARGRIAASNLLVVNHAMFFSDLNLRRDNEAATLLGDYDIAILDEAHTAETVAGDHFGLGISSGSIHFTLREMYNTQSARGLLALIGDRDAIRAVEHATASADHFFATLADYQGPGVSSSGRVNQPDFLPDTLSGPLRDASARLKALRSKIDNDDQRFELLGAESKLVDFADQISEFMAQSLPEQAYWYTSHRARRRDGKPGMLTVRLASSPICVGPLLKDALFDATPTVGLISATLSTEGGKHRGFDYIRKRLGLDEETMELQLTSPFDYRQQARLYIETQLGNPNQLDNFAPRAGGALRHYIEKSQGRCFILCTSYRMLDALSAEIEEFAAENQYELLVQGRDLQRGQMLARFRAGERCILMGTMSFWQGVDVAGEQLSNVIIVKLPFAVPDSPLLEARIETIRRDGGNPFGELQLPQAVILFKQGFGRLIRSKRDSGFVVILDHRIVTKSYGRTFLKSLPDIEVIRDQFSTTSEE
ncbi:MAG: helicase [Phycisphaerales bacterium]|jgi:ATP-dependent DNA helicase DinG|nr:helicase [Phycisphaerales bacterium]